MSWGRWKESILQRKVSTCNHNKWFVRTTIVALYIYMYMYMYLFLHRSRGIPEHVVQTHTTCETLHPYQVWFL